MSTKVVDPMLGDSRIRFPSPLSLRLRIGRRYVPTWVILLVGYGLSRILTTGLLAGAWALASTQGWTIAHFDGNPGFLGYLQSWDGPYYRQVALHGYPTSLPADSAGNVEKNAWAFLPLYPMIVRAIMAVTGLDFAVAGVLVALVFGAAATFALHRLLLQRFGSTTALWGALFFCFGPMSFVLEVTYAESVFLFFMFCALAAMMSRRYLVMIPFGVAAAFAHPGALALAAALGIHGLVRLLRREPFPVRSIVSAVTAVVVIAAAGLAWPLIASAVTGDPSGYFKSELSWWSDYLGRVHFFPFTPWFLFAGHYWGLVGILLVIAVLAGFVWWMTRRSVRALGTDLLAYTGSYVAYLVAVFLPQQSLFRMLLPLSPLLGHPTLSRTPTRRGVTLAVSILLQPVGILLFWVIWPP
ncbi:MAG TPA: hypothetical protein VGC18_00705 [Lacisediminihabitans sp.]|uniref:hypothetical protein n=1 Tax=Lacisediminihabitans sp. TaxID=2787631 RepID=UPI002ED8261D